MSRTASYLLHAWLLTCVVGGLWMLEAVAAPLTPDQKKEVAGIKGDLSKVGGLIGKKKYDEAEKQIAEAEERLEKLIKEGKVDENDPILAPVFKLLSTHRLNLGRKTGAIKPGEGSVSFTKDIAPILVENCLSCHDNDARGGLRLDTFAGLEKGGTNGILVIPGNPNQSLLALRLVSTNLQQRMPKEQPPLNNREIEKIVTWIKEGARFDGNGKTVALSRLKEKSEAGEEGPPPIVAATGSEKVSFVKDIAPTFVNLCSQCHNPNNARSGFSLDTFETLMTGGDTGQVIKPGSPAESRLWRLVNADDDPVMPQGQGRITRKWHADVRTWIEEGAKFDGGDPKRPLRQLIPSEAEMRQAELAKLSPEEFAKRRRETAIEQFQKTLPAIEPTIFESAEFVILGDVEIERLKQADRFATEHLKKLRDIFDAKETPLWKGKLAITMFKDRFGYEEFHQTVHRREVPKEILGHSEATPVMDVAMVVLQDVGDQPSETNPGFEMSLAEQLTGAFLKSRGGNYPDWLLKGAGLALAAPESGRGNHPYLSQQKRKTAEILRSTMLKPEELLANGSLSPTEIGPVGYSLVDFLLKQGGPTGMRQLIKRLQAGEPADTSLRNVYGAEPRALAIAFASAVAPGASKKPKK